MRAGLRQCNRSRKSGGPAADHDHVEWRWCIVHIGTIDVPGGIFKPASRLDIPGELRG
jgi:hypothetical protein